MTTVAGSGLPGAIDGPAGIASFDRPAGLAPSGDGTKLYVADSSNEKIRVVDLTTGAVSTLAGSGSFGATDGMGTAASFHSPVDLAIHVTTLYVADTNGRKIRVVDLETAVVSTFAGSGSSGATDAVGIAASFNRPHALAISSVGMTLYVADDFNNKIRVVDVATRAVSTLAGSGVGGSSDGVGPFASFRQPNGLALSMDDTTLYVSDRNNHKIRSVDVITGAVSTLVGSGTEGSTDATGVAATFTKPHHLDVSNDGTTLYVADRYNHKIRAVDLATRAVNTLAGSGSIGATDGVGTAASFDSPFGLVVSIDGTALYVADDFNHKIRVVRSPPPAVPSNLCLCVPARTCAFYCPRVRHLRATLPRPTPPAPPCSSCSATPWPYKPIRSHLRVRLVHAGVHLPVTTSISASNASVSAFATFASAFACISVFVTFASASAVLVAQRPAGCGHIAGGNEQCKPRRRARMRRWNLHRVWKFLA